MECDLVLQKAPPLNSAWLEHEKGAGLLDPQPTFKSPKDKQQAYSAACKARNAAMLSNRDEGLTEDVNITDTNVLSRDGQLIGIRVYQPGRTSSSLPPSGAFSKFSELPQLQPDMDTPRATPSPEREFPKFAVIYYHGGGLQVGDLDSEDLSCRRIAKEASADVYSVDYRLMPDVSASTAVEDAYDAFIAVTEALAPKPTGLIIVGSSSGGQLAAQVAELARNNSSAVPIEIDGLLLRCPVTVDATEGGIHIPPRFREMHKSLTPSFETSLAREPAYTSQNRAPNLPLEAESFEGLPKTFIQVCSNDIYYSDGICYGKALHDAGVKVKVEVIRGWPHTFWLKAPHLERALGAEIGMLEGLRWLLKG